MYFNTASTMTTTVYLGKLYLNAQSNLYFPPLTQGKLYKKLQIIYSGKL